MIYDLACDTVAFFMYFTKPDLIDLIDLLLGSFSIYFISIFPSCWKVWCLEEVRFKWLF